MTSRKDQFIHKLFALIQVASLPIKEENELLCWVDGGRSFVIRDFCHFEKVMLPQYFRMRKFVSFTRKLTKYGFTRSKFEGESFRFFHKYFNADKIEINKITKLTEQELLPKHIKLQLMREKFQNIEKIQKKPELLQPEHQSYFKQINQINQSLIFNFLFTRPPNLLHSSETIPLS